MKPFYKDDFVTLYHGDCREIVPTLGKFDLLLTDPPYGIGADKDASNNKRGGVAKQRQYLKTNWDQHPPMPETITLLKDAATHQILWGGNFYEGNPRATCWLVWDKDNGTNDFADCELAWTNLKCAVRKFRWRWSGFLKEQPEDRFHPTQKPLALMSWCLSFVPDAKTVLDPFAGSGTTGRACKDKGIQCTLIEQDERYCEIIVKRMQQEVLSL